MKWINHQVVTGVIMYAATEDLLLTACGMAGAIFPDKVEGNPRRGLMSWGWRSRHRGWSHWPLLYVAVIGLLLKWQGVPSLLEFPAGGILSETSPMRIGIALCLGALLHIAEDAVCGKVPVLYPNRKWGLRLFKVGSVAEYVFALAVVLLCYMVKVLV